MVRYKREKITIHFNQGNEITIEGGHLFTKVINYLKNQGSRQQIIFMANKNRYFIKTYDIQYIIGKKVDVNAN